MFQTSFTLSPFGVKVFGGVSACKTFTNTFDVAVQPSGWVVAVSVYSVSFSGEAIGFNTSVSIQT